MSWTKISALETRGQVNANQSISGIQRWCIKISGRVSLTGVDVEDLSDMTYRGGRELGLSSGTIVLGAT